MLYQALLKMACANPINQMLYQVLLNKAASYTNQPYKARAYNRAAESIRNCPFDLRTKEHPEDIFFIGPRIAKYIKDFINHPCSISFCSTCPLAAKPQPPIIKRETAGGGPAVPQCKVPANQSIYEALMQKAASYPSSATQPVKELYRNAAKAKAYRKAAESVAAWLYDLRNDYVDAVPNVGPSISKFIEDFFNSTPTAAPKLLTPKEVVEAVKQNVQARAAGGGVSSAQMSSFVKQNAEARAEKEEKETILIPTCRKITVQKLIDTLQAAVKKNPTVAVMEFRTSWYDWSDCGWGPYELGIANDGVWLTTGDPDIPKY